MFSINFINPSQKMEFQEKEYLIANYDIGNILLEKTEIPYFAFDFTLLSNSSVWLQTLSFETSTGNFEFVDYKQLDTAKLNSNWFEGYNLTSENSGICRLVFKNVSNDIYKISTNLLTYDYNVNGTINPECMTVVNGWIPFDYTLINRVSDNQFKILNQDQTTLVGCGIKFNSIISHFIKEAVYDGTDTLLTVTGVGAIPTSIIDFKYKYQNFSDSRKYWWASLNADNEPSILGLDINANELYWNSTTATIVYAANKNLDEGSNPNGGTYNFSIENLDLVSSNIALTTGYSDCGILLQNNIVKFHNEIKLKTILGTGSNDVGRGLVEIIAFN